MRRLISLLYFPAQPIAVAGQPTTPPQPRPSITFLVILHGLIFFALGAVGNHALGVVFHVPVTLTFMALSAVPQVLVRRVVERKHFLRPLPRTFAYLSPFFLLMTLSAVLPHLPQAPNKLHPAASHDGRYEAWFSSPPGGWNILVVDKETGRKWTEETSFLPHFQIYWRWDDAHRLWIYNSDDAGVHYLESAGDGWRLQPWGHDHRPEFGMSSITPPPELYPTYAQEER